MGFLRSRSWEAFSLPAIFRTLPAAHPALWFLIPWACLLIFSGLGERVLQVDEGADTFISTTILQSGLPRHSDGVHSSMPYADVHDGLFVYRTWLPYYLQAASLAGFGKTAFAARLPFALSGVASIIALYLLAFHWSGCRRTASLAAFFLSCSVPALLYFRTARYIALPILLTPCLLLAYAPIFEHRRWNPLPFILCALALFHTMYVQFAGLLLGVLLHYLTRRQRVLPENQKQVWISAGWIAGLTLPWLFFIYPVFPRIAEFYRTTSDLIDASAWGYFKQLAGYLFQTNNYIFPFILLPLLFLRTPPSVAEPVRLCGIVLAALFATASMHSIPLFQYVAAGLPLLFFLLAVCVVHTLPGGAAVKFGVAAVLVSSNLLHVGPLFPLKRWVQPDSAWIAGNPYLEYAAKTFQREITPASALTRYGQEITHPYPGPLDSVVDFFKVHGKPGETCYIDNEPESLAFHTELHVIPNEALTRRHRPDWIVLRGDRIALDTAGSGDAVNADLKSILASHPYRSIRLDIPVWRINNSYDVQLHRFRPFASSESVTVYRLESATAAAPPSRGASPTP